MNPIDAFASALNRSIDAAVAYLKENGVAIAMLLAGVYFFRSRYAGGKASRGHVLSSPSEAAGILENSGNADSRREDMRRARERQQELATQRSREAAVLKAKKDAEERDRKNSVARNNATHGGNRLGSGGAVHGGGGGEGGSGSGSGSGGTGPTSRGRNPLQPWNSNSSSYRPARRTPNA